MHEQIIWPMYPGKMPQTSAKPTKKEIPKVPGYLPGGPGRDLGMRMRLKANTSYHDKRIQKISLISSHHNVHPSSVKCWLKKSALQTSQVKCMSMYMWTKYHHVWAKWISYEIKGERDCTLETTKDCVLFGTSLQIVSTASGRLVLEKISALVDHGYG